MATKRMDNINFFSINDNKVISKNGYSGMNTLNGTGVYAEVTTNESGTLTVSFTEVDRTACAYGIGSVEIENPNAFLANAFSLQMLEDLNSQIQTEEVDFLPFGLTSAIGHENTARVIGVPYNRCNVSLKKGDTLYVAQLVGGRLPEWSTTLPDGFTFKFVKVTIL